MKATRKKKKSPIEKTEIREKNITKLSHKWTCLQNVKANVENWGAKDTSSTKIIWLWRNTYKKGFWKQFQNKYV